MEIVGDCLGSLFIKLPAFEFLTQVFNLGHIAGGSSLLDNFLDVTRFGVFFACEH